MSLHTACMYAAGLQSEQDLQISLPCIRPGICLWINTELQPPAPSPHQAPVPPVPHVVTARVTHVDIPLVPPVSCQTSHSIPHLFYCYLIDIPPPRVELSRARTFVWYYAISKVEKVGFLVGLPRRKEASDSNSSPAFSPTSFATCQSILR